jgi:hypothetical protein
MGEPNAEVIASLFRVFIKTAVAEVLAEHGPVNSSKTLIDDAELCRRLDIGASKLDALVKEGRIAPIRVGVSPRYDWDEILADARAGKLAGAVKWPGKKGAA